MAMNKYPHNIEPLALDGSNFSSWKYRVKLLLMEKDIIDIIEKQFDESIYDTEEKKKDFKTKDIKARSLIVQCVSDRQLELIKNKDSAYDMWKTLGNTYEKKGLPGQLYLRRKLNSMKLSEGENLDEFLVKFDEIVGQLKNAGTDMKEQDVVCNLLMSLPKSYEIIVSVLENLSEDSLTLDFVKSKLKAENEKRKMNTEESKSRPLSAAFNSQRSLICYGCGERGHYKRDCKSKRSSENTWKHNRGQGRGQNGNFKRQNQVKHSVGTSGTQRQAEYAAEEQNSVCFMSGDVPNSEGKSLTFCIDSACTDHLVNCKDYFNDCIMLKNPIKIAVAKDGDYMEAVGIGNILAISKVGNKTIKCTIKNVLYVPKLRRNLLSVKQLESANLKVIFFRNEVKLIDKNKGIVAIGKRNNLYELKFEINSQNTFNVIKECNNVELWHKRFGHLGYSYLKGLIKHEMVEGLENVEANKVEFCKACVNGKMIRLPFGQRTRSKRILEIVHSDVCGPISPTSIDDNKYFVTFIDDFSNFTIVYLIKTKDEVFNCFKEYIQMAQSMFNTKLAKLRCDNGGEYVSQDLRKFCKENGIILDYTIPYTPQLNGKAERMNRTLVEKARCLLSDAGMPKEFWGEAIRCSTYLLNRSPTGALNDNVTPAEMWFGKKPSVRNLKVFGTEAFAYIPGELRKKFDMKAERCVMLGYAPCGYRLWNITERKIIVSRDVKFNEGEFYYRRSIIQIPEDNDKNDVNMEDDIEENEISDEENKNTSNTMLTRESEKRTVNLPKRFEDYEMYMAFDAMSYIENVPQSYDEVNEREDKECWMEAMKREIESINENETWELVKTPRDKEILDTKWVYTYKPLENDIKDRYKARLVVRGFAQKDNFDYDNLYSPVAKMTTIRTLLAIANQFSFELEQMDVKTAFLNGRLLEDIYIHIPKGIEQSKEQIYKLNKSLYGLRQSSKCWNDRINEFLLYLNFTRSQNDYCLYFKITTEGQIYLLLYVDDIILASDSRILIEGIKRELINEFKIKDKGQLRYFLGLEVNYNKEEGILSLSQNRYLNGILRRFGFDNCKPSSLPIDPKLRLKPCENEKEKTKKPFRELVGCLMYLMLGTRPDISFTLNYYSKFQDKATDETFEHLKRVLRYLKESSDLKLIYKRQDKPELITYVDANWGGDLNDRRSITGFLLKVFDNTVSWTTRKQNCVTLSSTEAELTALCSAVCEGLWLRKLLLDLGIKVKSLLLYEDNNGCISIIKNPENNRRVKHIDLKYNFVSDYVKAKQIEIKYVNSANQQADVLTKATDRTQFYKNRLSIGLV